MIAVEDSLLDAIELFDEYPYQQLLVIEGATLVGFLRRADLLPAIAEAHRELVKAQDAEPASRG